MPCESCFLTTTTTTAPAITTTSITTRPLRGVFSPRVCVRVRSRFGIAGMVGQELARHEKLFGAATDMGTTMAMPDSGKVSDLAAEMANVLNSTQ